MAQLSVKGYRVPKTSLSESEARQLVKSLLVKPYSPVDNGWIKPVGFFQETQDALYLPRHFAEQKYGRAAWEDEEDIQHLGNFPFTGSLRVLSDGTSQHEACAVTLRMLRDHGGCILSLYTGAGKTTCALWIARQMGLKTAVVVHKDPLMTQWKERIEQFLPGARVGTLRGDASTVRDDDDFTLCMIQSLLSPTRSHEGLSKFGLVILDEVHHVAARMFSRVFNKLSRPHMLGLSATVNRKDRLDSTFGWFIGPVSFKAELRDCDVNVRVVTHSTDVKVTLNKRQQVNFTQMITDLTQEESRNQLITDVLGNLGQRRGVLVLSDRRDHCKLLHGMCNEDAMLLMGGVKNTAELHRLYFGTYSLMSEGVDIPHLDTLVMATPRADVKQSVGRILRGSGSNRLVVDIVDKLGPLFAQSRKRKQFYKASGFKLNESTIQFV